MSNQSPDYIPPDIDAARRVEELFKSEKTIMIDPTGKPAAKDGSFTAPGFTSASAINVDRLNGNW